MKNDMTDVKISVIVPCHNVVGMVGSTARFGVT